MSKIGKLPVDIKEGVAVSFENKKIIITGFKGSLSYLIPEGIKVSQVDNKLNVSEKPLPKGAKSGNRGDLSALFGLTRAIIANMIKGVITGFEKKLELSGVGYRAQVLGNDLVLSVGFSHTVKIKADTGIKFTVSENVITVSGIDKGLVGDVAAKIRAIRPPEPYKGKGISYKGEKIRRKAGKAAKAVGAK